MEHRIAPTNQHRYELIPAGWSVVLIARANYSAGDGMFIEGRKHFICWAGVNHRIPPKAYGLLELLLQNVSKKVQFSDIVSKLWKAKLTAANFSIYYRRILSLDTSINSAIASIKATNPTIPYYLTGITTTVTPWLGQPSAGEVEGFIASYYS